MGRGTVESREKVTLAIDRDKGSQHAIKWAVDNLVTGGQHLILLHVKQTMPAVSAVSQGEETENVYKKPVDPITKELFLPFRSFCSKKLVSRAPNQLVYVLFCFSMQFLICRLLNLIFAADKMQRSRG